MKENEFNPELFKEVFTRLANTELQGMLAEVDNEIYKRGNQIRTEDETRKMAANFYKKQLAKVLFEKLNYIE